MLPPNAVQRPSGNHEPRKTGIPKRKKASLEARFLANPITRSRELTRSNQPIPHSSRATLMSAAIADSSATATYADDIFNLVLSQLMPPRSIWFPLDTTILGMFLATARQARGGGTPGRSNKQVGDAAG
jgi:hypothetical protein